MQKKDELVNSLSGGMKRKLSIAIALIGSPEVSCYNIIIIMLSLNACFVLRYKIGHLCLDINLRWTNIRDGSRITKRDVGFTLGTIFYLNIDRYFIIK